MSSKNTRACLKIAFCKIPSQFASDFMLDLGGVVGYIDEMQHIIRCKVGRKIVGMNFQTRSSAPVYKQVTNREKYCFGIGAIGKDSVVNMVAAFLMLYFTDTLFLAPAFVGGLFFVARVWDAVNDPVMGMIVDNTRTKYGKFRIWLSVGTLLNSVVFVLLFKSFGLQGNALYAYVSVVYIVYGMTYTIMDVPYWSWLPNLTNDPRQREKVSVVPRFFASLAGFCIATFGLYIIQGFNEKVGKGKMDEYGFTMFAAVIVVIFIITIAITVFNVGEEATTGGTGQKVGLKQAVQVITKNKELLAFIGLLLTFNLCTQIVWGFAVYYFKVVCGNEYLYSVFGGTKLAEMLGLVCFPMIAGKITREKTYTLACALPVVGLALLGICGVVMPSNAVLVVICCCLFMFGSGLSLGVTTCCIADVIDYGEVKFGTRNESIICSTQTFLMKSAQAAAGLFTGIGLQMVGYNAKLETQSAFTVNGLRALMVALPIFMAVCSYLIYTKCYTLKGKKMDEVTEQMNQLRRAQGNGN